MSIQDVKTVDDSNVAKKALECGVCLESYKVKDKRPVLLECGHTLCESCAEKLKIINNDDGKKHISCPFCRQLILVPAQGMKTLKHNFALQEVIESLDALLKLAPSKPDVVTPVTDDFRVDVKTKSILLKGHRHVVEKIELLTCSSYHCGEAKYNVIPGECSHMAKIYFESENGQRRTDFIYVDGKKLQRCNMVSLVTKLCVSEHPDQRAKHREFCSIYPLIDVIKHTTFYGNDTLQVIPMSVVSPFIATFTQHRGNSVLFCTRCGLPCVRGSIDDPCAFWNESKTELLCIQCRIFNVKNDATHSEMLPSFEIDRQRDQYVDLRGCSWTSQDVWWIQKYDSDRKTMSLIMKPLWKHTCTLCDKTLNHKWNLVSRTLMESIFESVTYSCLIEHSLLNHPLAQHATLVYLTCIDKRMISDRLLELMLYWDKIKKAKLDLTIEHINARSIASTVIEIVMRDTMYDEKHPLPSKHVFEYGLELLDLFTDLTPEVKKYYQCKLKETYAFYDNHTSLELVSATTRITTSK